MSAAAELAALEHLDRTQLYFFVLGPGRGEAIAIALPTSGWLLIDSCRVAGARPQIDILSRWRRMDGPDPVVMIVLTHPHGDHADGFADVVHDAHPLAVGIPGNGPPELDLLRAAEAASRAIQGAPTDIARLSRSVRAAMTAITSWSQRTGGQVHVLHDGATVPTLHSPVEVTCRAPHSAGLSRILGGDQILARANHMSIVLEIQFGRTRIVTTGDLPRYEPNGTTRVETGWDAVLSIHPSLASSHAVKLPHHGSREAIHPDLIADHEDCTFIVAPNSTSALPRLDPGDAVDQLLALAPGLCLTTVPTRSSAQPRWIPPAVVSIAQLRATLASPTTGDPVIDRGVDTTPPPVDDSLDAVWCLAFDDQGALAGRWRGRRALEVVP